MTLKRRVRFTFFLSRRFIVVALYVLSGMRSDHVFPGFRERVAGKATSGGGRERGNKLEQLGVLGEIEMKLT